MLDINCDLGENEAVEVTQALLAAVDSANIACGVHAGNRCVMERTVSLAGQTGVNLGAHPGLSDGGRVEGSLDGKTFETLLLSQIGALEEVVVASGYRLHHVKLHGALYHMSEQRPELRDIYGDVMERRWPGVVVIARSGGSVARDFAERGINVWQEVFADRAYHPDGALLSRSCEGAVISDKTEVARRFSEFLLTGRVKTCEGGMISLVADTVCVHGDTMGAAALAGELRRIRDDFRAKQASGKGL